MLKWLIVVLVIVLVKTKGRAFTDLLAAVRAAPQSYRDGKARVDDPARFARKVGARSDTEHLPPPS